MEHQENQTPAELVEALECCYAAYIAQAGAAGGGGVAFLLGELLGNGERKRSRERALLAFRTEVENLVERLAAMLAELESQAASDAVLPCLERLLLSPPGRDRELDFALAAMEGTAQPLLPYLTDAEAGALALRYRARTKPHLMLPNQQKLLRALERH